MNAPRSGCPINLTLGIPSRRSQPQAEGHLQPDRRIHRSGALAGPHGRLGPASHTRLERAVAKRQTLASSKRRSISADMTNCRVIRAHCAWPLRDAESSTLQVHWILLIDNVLRAAMIWTGAEEGAACEAPRRVRRDQRGEFQDGRSLPGDRQRRCRHPDGVCTSASTDSRLVPQTPISGRPVWRLARTECWWASGNRWRRMSSRSSEPTSRSKTSKKP